MHVEPPISRSEAVAAARRRRGAVSGGCEVRPGELRGVEEMQIAQRIASGLKYVERSR